MQKDAVYQGSDSSWKYPLDFIYFNLLDWCLLSLETYAYLIFSNLEPLWLFWGRYA